MKRRSWLMIGLALAAGASAGADRADARAFNYDIHADFIVKSNYACGHWASYGGSPVSSIDWAVNGVVVAQDASGVNYQNDGSPYTVAIGEVNGGIFTEYYSEVFYPQDTPWIACFQV